MTFENAILFMREVHTGMRLHCVLNARPDACVVSVRSIGIHKVDDPVAEQVRALATRRRLNFRAGINRLDVW